jgi:hypothetical protein
MMIEKEHTPAVLQETGDKADAVLLERSHPF